MNFAQRGGYIPDSEGGATPASPSSKKGFTNNTVRPMTIKSLLESQITPDGRITLDNAETSSAVIYGCIRQTKESSNFFDLVIEDGSNSITVRLYFNNDKHPSEPFESGKWIRATVTAKFINQKPAFNASRVEVVRNFNEVLFHFALCMSVHVNSDQSVAPPSKLSNLTTAATEEFSPGLANLAGSLNPIQTSVLKVFADCKTMEGLHISNVARMLSEKYSEQSVRATYDWLLTEGYLYNTTDSDHAKSVME